MSSWWWLGGRSQLYLPNGWRSSNVTKSLPPKKKISLDARCRRPLAEGPAQGKGVSTRKKERKGCSWQCKQHVGTQIKNMVFGFLKTHTIHVYGMFRVLVFSVRLESSRAYLMTATCLLGSMSKDWWWRRTMGGHRETSLGFSHAVMPNDRSPRSLGREYCSFALTQLALYHIHCFKFELSQIFKSRQLKRPSYQSKLNKFWCAVIKVLDNIWQYNVQTYTYIWILRGFEICAT